MKSERKLARLLTEALLGLSDSCFNHVRELAVAHQQEPHSNIYRLEATKGRLRLANEFNEDLSEALDQWNNLSETLVKGDRQGLAKLLEVTAEITEKMAGSAVFVLKQKGKRKGIPIAPSHLEVSKSGRLEVVPPDRLDRSIQTQIYEINLLASDLHRRSPKPRVGGSSDFANCVSSLKKRGLTYKQIAMELHKNERFNDYEWLSEHGCSTWLDVLSSLNKRAFQKYLGHF